jgi:two-component system response regulator HydG
VLLLGESGTGKELVARAVHEASPRAAAARWWWWTAPACPRPCSRASSSAMSAGAFTGANTRAKAGLVEAASGGTLFLDEVGDIPLAMQVKLLRLLESGTYRRVGSTELRRTDMRVVSATHRDLQAMVARGAFREDLYYRLSTFPIRLPALRERRSDIDLLAQALLQRVAPRRRLSLHANAAGVPARAPLSGQCARAAQRAGTRGAAGRPGGAALRGRRCLPPARCVRGRAR